MSEYPLDNVAGALVHETQWIAEKVKMRDHGKDYSMDFKCEVGKREHIFHAFVCKKFAKVILEYCIEQQKKQVNESIAEIRGRLDETEKLMATDKLKEFKLDD